MVFAETKAFSRQVTTLLSDEDYREMQEHLTEHPDAGAMIKGTGGIRKLRWAVQGQGKSGGVRVIYYWAVAKDRILLLFMYPESERDDLSPEERKVLRRTVDQEDR
jgi:hypothetical protein